MPSRIELNASQDRSSLNVSNAIAKIRGAKQPKDALVAAAEAIEKLQAEVQRLQKAVRTAQTLKHISVESADIADLNVSAEEGPGQLRIFSGPPNYDLIGHDGTEESGTAFSIATAINGTITTTAPHTFETGQIVHITGTTSHQHLGWWVIGSTPTNTTFTIISPPSASGTGGLATFVFAGGWRRTLGVGGTGFSDAPLYADQQGVVRIGKGGYVLVVDQDETAVGFIGPHTEATKSITAWGVHTTGERTITITAHGWENGNYVNISGSGAGNGKWPVRKLDDDTLILLGSNVSHAGSGGSALRYFAGVWGESLCAAGTSPYTANVKLTAAGGFLKDVFIEITGVDSLGNAVVTQISPEQITITNEDENQTLQLSEGYVKASTITGDLVSTEMRPGSIAVEEFVGGSVFTGGVLETHTVGSDTGARLLLGDNAGTYPIELDGINGVGYFGSLEPTNPLDIPFGGTNATTEADARTNLDVYSKPEVDALIPDLSPYYTASQTDTAIANAIAAALGSYYDAATVDSLLAGKSSSTHTHIISVFNQSIPSTPNVHNHSASAGTPV